MPFILLYLFKLSVSLAVVFLFYYFILRKLTFYNNNRWYLLAYTVLSFFIPFINISPVLEKTEWSNSSAVSWVPVIGTPGTENVVVQNAGGISYWNVLLVIVLSGMIVMVARLLLQLFSFRKMLRKAEVISTGGMSLYQVYDNIIPFSFGNSIFINRHLHTETELQEIISHEFVHVKQHHSLDIIWGEVLCMLNWYNPFAWMIRKCIRQNLEFIADNKVLENGVDKKQYQYLLLKVIGNNQFSIASKFNFSSLKKRIAMMNKLKNTKRQLLRMLFLLPATALLLLAFRGKWNDRGPAPLEKKVSIAGLVLDAKSREPLPGVTIYCPEKQIEAVTDENGYYLLKLPYEDRPLQFSLSISKDGYHSMKQTENWGNFSLDPVREKYQYTYEFFTLAGNDGENNGSTILGGNASSPEQLKLDGVREALQQVIRTNSDVWGISSDTIPKARKVVQLPKEIEGIVVMRTQDEQEPVNQELKGMVVVVRKDGGKEIYDINSIESKKAFEKKYGVRLEEVVPPPPPTPPTPPIAVEAGISTMPPTPPTAVGMGVAVAPLTPPTAVGVSSTPEPPTPPVQVKLPENVKKISIDNKKATIWLKNGQKESYDLNDAEQKKKFDIKYGEFIIAPPREPSSGGPRAVERTPGTTRIAAQSPLKPTFATTTDNPLYVLDGEVTTLAELNKLPPESIVSVDVLKRSSATAVYGDKAKDGAVVVHTTASSPSIVVENVDIKIATATDSDLARATVYSQELDTKNSKKLVILDGKELPATVKNLSGSYRIITLTKEEAVKKYGEKGKNGVMEMTTIK